MAPGTLEAKGTGEVKDDGDGSCDTRVPTRTVRTERIKRHRDVYKGIGVYSGGRKVQSREKSKFKVEFFDFTPKDTFLE